MLVEVNLEPRIYRSGNEVPEGANCIRWVADARCWDITAPSTLEPGDIYIPAPWLEDL